MDTIIIKIYEFEKDIELLKHAISVLDKNFKSIKTEILKTYTKEYTSNEKKRKVEKKKREKEKNTTIFKKVKIQLSNDIKNFFFDNNNKEDSNDTFLILELNKKINAYLIEKDLIKNKKIYLNKELKNLLKTKKRIINLDEILNIIIKINNN